MMIKAAVKLVLSGLLFLCLLNMPYGYYQLVRFLSLVVFVVIGYSAIEEKRNAEGVFFFSLAVLFQPFFKIALGRTIWNIVDVTVGVALIVSVVFIDKKVLLSKRNSTI